jgi:hypothetical protein
MNTNDFIAQLDNQGGLAPMNRFVAQIAPPSSIIAPAGLHFYCNQAPLGARTIATSDLKHYGPVRKMARENTYAEFQLQFIITNAWEARNFFIKWMDLCVSTVSANMKYYNDYKGDIKVLAFNQSNESVATTSSTHGTHYIDVFPTNVDQVNLAWDQLNQLGQFSVNFVCRKWINLGAKGGNEEQGSASGQTGAG